MSWFVAGAAVVATTTYMGAQSNRSTAIRQGNAVSRAEGEAIVKERMNATIRNAYNTGLSQLQLGLEKRKLSQQGADISAATLAAQGDASTAAAASGSIGASVDAVASDIAQKSQQALDMTQEQFEMSLTNYNNDLDMMALNIEQSAPNVRKNEYIGPNNGQILMQSVMAGASHFASGYMGRQAKLGLGSTPTAPSPAGRTLP